MAKREPVEPPATPRPVGAGDRRFCLFYRDIYRTWDTILVTVMAVHPSGDIATVEIYGANLPNNWVGIYDAPMGSNIRFIETRMLHMDANAAMAYAKTLPTPASTQ